MINGDGTCKATCEVISPDSLPALRVPQPDDGDVSPPSSRYSSCGESEFDRYCSANSVMGTPSMCSTITVFNDFAEYDNNGLEEFSLGGGVGITSKDRTLPTSSVPDSLRDFKTWLCSQNIRNQPNLKNGYGGLELYDDDNNEFAMPMLNASDFMGINQLDNGLDQNFIHKDAESSEVSKGKKELGGAREYHAITTQKCLLRDVDGKCSQSVPTVGEGALSCAVSGQYELNGCDAQSNLLIGKEELETEEDGISSNCENSEGGDSMYKYCTDDDNKNEIYLPRSIHYNQESIVQKDDPLLLNSSVAFGSEDLDDFLLENEGNGQVSHMHYVFHNQKEKKTEVEESQTDFGSVSSIGFSSADQKAEEKDRKDMVIINERVEEIKDFSEPEGIKDVRDIPAARCQVQGSDKLTNITETSAKASTDFPNMVKPQVQGADKLVNFPKTSFTTKAYEVDLNLLAGEDPKHMTFNFTDERKGNLYMNTEEGIGNTEAQHVGNPELDNCKFISDSKVDQKSFNPAKHLGNTKAESFEESLENLERVVPSSNGGMRKTLDNFSTSTNLFEKRPVISKIENFKLNEFYDDVVHEMEEILLDSANSPGSRLSQGHRLIEPQLSMPLRDGGLTASTSNTYDACLEVQHPMRIDRIEVVGARQKKGDVSFSERLVGVKEYTVYKIKVQSGKDQWEIERRYRDFLTLYRCMKTLFTEQGWDLPLPWSSVEKESKKIFGSASPGVIVQRSVLLQECLQSILHTRLFSSPPSALIWFLSPPSALVSHSFTRATNNRNCSSLGKTISLIVEIPPCKSMKQMLEAQHNSCAGCHKHFDDGKTLIQDIVLTFGWGKPRLCEYTGQLFCSSCHTNEIAVLPARVLHHWDFTHFPVSQLAKSYLDSIHDQPMLCVTAVNPILLSKIPALHHVISVRKTISTMLPNVLCPFRRSINRGLGKRRYLLESNDFFALRDLIDLSKGAFAALPVMVETVSRKILKHITDQCLICCDVGVPCSARQDCSDPCSLIFPFQEDEIERCTTCQSVFHKPCFRKLANCLCGAHLRLDETRRLTNKVSQRGIGETRGTLNLLGVGLGSGLSSRFFSGLFTKEKSEKTREHKDENIILMGSLPSTSL